MNCNCIEDLKDSALERLTANKEIIEDETKIGCREERLFASQKNSTKGLALTFVASFRQIKTNGEPYKNKTNDAISVTCKYCPICGEPIFEAEGSDG
jgi:hypothetical protein